ncbi:MAG: non-homologous end joining protein Ku [Thermincolia bacterium]
MRSMWKGAISFGLVNVPVKMYSVTENKDIKFNYLHEKCKTPVKYQRYCPACDAEIGMEEIVRGYEYEKGRYVIMAEEDFEKIPVVTTKAVEIMDFVNLNEIDPIYYDKSYYLVPNEGGQKAYALLKKAMEDSNRVAIAKVVIRSKEALCALRAYDNCLVMETMYYPDEVRSTKYLPELDYNVKLNENEMKMAVNLIGSLEVAFEPEKYINQYREALSELIQAKITGEEIAVPEAPDATKVVDLMEALKASIQMAKEQKKGDAQGKDEAGESKKRKRKTS